MKFRASHRHADMTPRKIRPFANLIRKKTVDEALQLLKFQPNRGARLLEKTLLSAKGNAEYGGLRDTEDMIVIECRVDGGPTFKRFMPRARGTAYQILRRTSHIHVMIAEASDVFPPEDLNEDNLPQVNIVTTTTTPDGAAPVVTVQPATTPPANS